MRIVIISSLILIVLFPYFTEAKKTPVSSNEEITLRVFYGHRQTHFTIEENGDHYILRFKSNQYGIKKQKLSKKNGRYIASVIKKTQPTKTKISDCFGYKIEASYLEKGKRDYRFACLGYESKTRDELVKIADLLSDYVDLVE